MFKKLCIIMSVFYLVFAESCYGAEPPLTLQDVASTCHGNLLYSIPMSPEYIREVLDFVSEAPAELRYRQSDVFQACCGDLRARNIKKVSGFVQSCESLYNEERDPEKRARICKLLENTWTLYENFMRGWQVSAGWYSEGVEN